MSRVRVPSLAPLPSEGHNGCSMALVRRQELVSAVYWSENPFVKHTSKPVRKCHACLLNFGDHCWLYKYPRGQWRRGRICPALGNELIYEKFRVWEKQPRVKTRKDLRREFFHTTKKAENRYNLSSATGERKANTR
ncbi:MAG: hypothetical protein JXN60_09110 [Lentisphaerae bacterium]|nr:hypothetical protein [Lentisphaerota bacterium]